MPLPTIAGVHRVALEWTGPSGQSAANVLHVEAAGLTASDVATAIDGDVTQQMWMHTASSFQVTRMVVTPLDGHSASFVFPTSGLKWTGDGGASDFSPAVAAIVSLRSAERGARARGRLYLPGVVEGLTTAGVLNANVATAQTAWNAFLAALAADSCALVVASYTHAEAFTVTSVVYESVVATQRRRQSRLR